MFLDKYVDASIVKEGFNHCKWRHDYFQHQAQSDSHRVSVLKTELLEQPVIDAQLSSQHNKTIKLLTVACLSFIVKVLIVTWPAARRHDDLEGNLMQLLLVNAEDYPQLQQWITESKYHSPQIINELSSISSKKLSRVLLIDVR